MNRYKKLLDEIEDLGGRNAYKPTNNPLYVWNRAFDIYNKENKRKLRKGCGDCMRKVYNWLMANA